MEKTRDVLVVKVGTSTLTETQEDGSERLDAESFRRIGKQIVEIQESGVHVVLVSSAAITAGMASSGLTARPNKGTEVHELQRLASTGWRKVLNAWESALAGKTIGELLITQHELDLDSERDELIRVICTLLSHGDIPIINENDAITHEEIAFGDNDILAASFAVRLHRSAMFGRVRLVILSDVDGVYTDKNDPGSVIKRIDDIDAYEHVAGKAASPNGTGGMKAKFKAAKLVTENGVEMWITHGRTDKAIQRALDNEIGTGFGHTE
jgi:glutamate 5-kinase